MVVRGDHVLALQSFLAKDFEEYDRLAEEFERTDGWGGYHDLLQAAFFEAVDGRFGRGHTVQDIVQYVANARAHYEHSGQQVDPRVAERLMLIALGDEPPADDMDGEAIGAAELFILTTLITQENLDSDGLTEFMERARQTANEMPG